MPPSPSSDSSAVPSQHPPSSMSQATKEMLARVRRMIPPMLEKFHKGVPSSNFPSIFRAEMGLGMGLLM